MQTHKTSILQLPESVREDTLGYRAQVNKFLEGQTSSVAFRAYRVPMGIYEQRTTGKYMVRIRIGAGMVLPFQLERVAELSKAHGDGIVHVTTRQDLQIHAVNIENTPDVMEGLLDAELSPRGGGGNTVRNVTACPRAGVCPKEVFNVAPYAVAAAEYLLQDRSSFNLPRKYKIVFSGCSDDCAFASVADLGFFAHVKDGVRGFCVYAGGGLGANPAVGVRIEDFIEPGDIFVVAEAVKQLFDKHGDRANKHKARLRYVLARVGEKEFVELYKREKEILKSSGLSGKLPPIRVLDWQSSASAPPEQQGGSDHGNVLPEKEPGRCTVRLVIKKGNIPADDLKAVGRIAKKYGQGVVRATQLQDLLITGVARGDIEAVTAELRKLSIDVLADSRPKIVACAGASTCKLGLCHSRGLADAISTELERTSLRANGSQAVIRISGCPNSCGHHYIAGIGLQGKAKRVNGKLMPCYDVLVGAEIAEGRAHLAERIGTVPAKQVPALLSQALATDLVEKEQLRSLVEKYSRIGDEPPQEYYYDYGSDEPFSLAGRGPGECGAGVMDVMKLDIDEAKDALRATPPGSTDIYRAIVAAARALLITFGLEPKKDREIFAAFGKHLIEPGWVKAQTQQVLDDAVDWRMGDKESIEDLLPDVSSLVERIEELFLSLDANLKFKVGPVEQRVATEQAEKPRRVADLRGVACPLNFVKAKLALEKLAAGEILDVLLDAGEPMKNVPASFSDQGQEILDVTNLGDHFCVKVRRRK